MSAPRWTVAAALLAAAACAPAPRAGPVATAAVNLPRSYRFDPAAITVPAGTRVTWTNADVFTHSVRLLDLGDTNLVMKPGESVSYTFTQPGVHRYDCAFHGQMMQGTVAVTAAK
ncbi:MAG TPA: plastocyanin/azurin family copper-binding protein [Opitutaceae bacterium]|nr:plastocyanin/azurin family copper-binding protein [Opitutaceae bacterium]